MFIVLNQGSRQSIGEDLDETPAFWYSAEFTLFFDMSSEKTTSISSKKSDV